ncbi:MAG: nucleotidyltransferase [Acidobacteria bacterium]|nr:nucleotidyltransferase [Acidobacteriota bacterium]
MSEANDKPVPVTTSLEPEYHDQQRRLYREVLGLLNQLPVPYAVSGAFALQHHTGIWRDTKDLDLFLTSEDVGRALEALAAAGLECKISDPVWLAKAHRGEFFVDLITGMSNAVIVVDKSWLARGAAAVVVGVETKVLAAEELIASKLFVTRRERFDGADIAHIIYGTAGKLDWDRVLELAAENWEMLLWALLLFRFVYPAQTSYVPARVWDDLIGRFISVIKNPDPKARFRGSLIDERQFAIDIEEWRLDNVLAEYRARRNSKLPSLIADRTAADEKAS